VRPPDPLEAIAAVASAFDLLGVRWYIGGSVASSARGLARASLDVDVVADLRPGHATPFVARLRDAFYASEEAVAEAIRTRGSFNVIHLPTGMKVDVFVLSGRSFDRQALERAVAEPLDAEGSGPRYPVATAEDVILAKLDWFRLGGETSERQWGDVLGVLRTSGPSIDPSYLESTAESLGLSDLLRRALAEV